MTSFPLTGHEGHTHNSVMNVRTKGRVIAQALTSLDSDRGGPGSTPGQDLCALWWTKWLWGTFSPSTSVSPANLHLNNLLHNHQGLGLTCSGRSAEWTQSHPNKN
jgi:hypothetical protein